MKIIKMLFAACLVSLLWLSSSGTVFATSQEFSAEGDYRLGDRDTREDAKKAALTEAKRKIVEQAGVYIESYTEVNNFQVSQDKIMILAKGIIKIKTERTEFSENGMLCRAYVTATVDMKAFEDILKKLIEVAKHEKTKPDTADKPVKVDNPKPPVNKPVAPTSNVEEFGTPKVEEADEMLGELAIVERARTKMVRDLSKATAYTAGSEYKLQEVIGLKHIGNHAEKGDISNYLKEHYEMNKNYRFAELTPFVEEAGSKRIIEKLNEINKKKSLDAKDRMTWAKIERTRAKSYGDIVLKEAAALFERVDELIISAKGDVRERLRVIRIEADDAIKLIKALEIRNKAVDEVTKKYEKANKIKAEKDKNPPKDLPAKKKKNVFDELFK